MESTPKTEQQTGLLYYVSILLRWKKFILLNVVIVTGIAVVAAFLLPRFYIATVTLIPPKNPNPLSPLGYGSSNLLRQINNPLRALGGGGASPDLYNYLSILKSRDLLKEVVYKFDLFAVYDVNRNRLHDAIDKLETMLDFVVTEEGTIVIETTDESRDRAIAMNKFIVAKLDELNRRIGTTEAKSNREFIEKRVKQNIAELRASEDSLKVFQEETGMILPTPDVASSAKAMSDMYVEKMMKEFEVGVLERALGEDNPILQTSQWELQAIESKLGTMPEMGVTFYRLYRDYLIQQKLYEILLPILEQAKIEEHKSTPTILVLDQSFAPSVPSLPKKKVIVGIFFAIALLLSIAIAFIVERINVMRAENPAAFERLSASMRWGKRTKKLPPVSS